MDKSITKGRRSLLIVYLALALLVVLNSASHGAADDGPTVLLGQSEIKLIPYPGFILIDDSNAEAFKLAQGVPGNTMGMMVLATYTDSAVWNRFTHSITPDGPKRMLECGAEVSTHEDAVDKVASLEIFGKFTKERLIPELTADGSEIIDINPRYVTFMNTYTVDGQPRYKIISSVVLVEGKVLLLETYFQEESRSADQLQSSALAWRDAYLKETKP